MKILWAMLALVAALVAAPSLATPAVAQPCQWNYTEPGNVSTATYCGNVQVNGTINAPGINQVGSIAALQALVPLTGQVEQVTGYYTSGDGFAANFIWNGSSTATATVCGPFAETGSATGRWISQSPISFRGCGAHGNGTSDDTSALQAALNTAGIIKVEPGNYFITTTLIPVSGNNITGGQTSIISYDFSGATHVGCAISTADLSSFEIRFITFQNTTSPASEQYYPICLYHPNNVWIEHITTIGAGLGLVDSTSVTGYAGTTDANSPHNIHVNFNNIGNGATTATIARSGFLFSYARQWEAIGNAVSGTVFGLYWSGGDANVNGALGNERKAYNGSVVGNYVHDTSAGAIWGSMGQNLAINGNTVINGGDVGLDDEGGLNNTWTGNTCAEMSNGCITTFYLPVNVAFVGNSLRQSVAGHPLIRTYNVNLSGLSSVRFDSNVINWTGTGVGEVDDNNGPVGTLTFNNNTLLNTVVLFASINEHITTVRGNNLTFTNACAATCSGITVSHNDAQGSANGVLTIANNIVQSQVTQPSGSFGIASVQDDLGLDPLVSVTGNGTFGFPADIHLTWSGTGSTVIMRATVSNNIFGAGVWGRSEGGTNPSVIHLISNTHPDGTPFPSSTDVGSAYWNAGQIFYVAAPAASGSIGVVQTVSGAPGTQKGWGPINP